MDAGAIIFHLKAIGAQVFKKELDDVDAAAKKVTQSTQGTAKSTEDLGKKQDETAKKSGGLGRELRTMSADAQHASSTVGRSLLGVGAALVGVTALAVKFAIDWESAWAGVTKTVDATPDQLDDIEDGLRDLTKVLPATHGEIAAVAEAAGQLGVAAKDVVGFTKTMVDLGETTNLTSDEAATSIAQLMNIMQTAPEDVGRLGSALVALGNNGASTERDIVQMAQRIAGAGKTVGLTEAEVLSLANALASAGIEVEAGGSAISRIMIDIAKQVSTNGKDLEKWAGVAGMTTTEFSQAFKDKPAQAINSFILGLGRMNAAGGDVFTTLEELGQSDIRVTNALLSMANAGDLLTDSLKTGDKAWAENIALQTEAEKRYDTTAAKIQIMANNVNDAAINFGSVFLPAIADVTSAISNFSSFVADVPEPVMGMVAVVGLGVGAIALFGGALLIAVPKVAEFRQAVTTLSTEMPIATARVKGFASFLGGPWGIAIGIAIAVAGAFAKSNMDSATRVDALTDSLDKQTGAYTEVTRAAVVKALTDDKTFEAAKRVGVSLDLITDAALGNKDAISELAAAEEEYRKTIDTNAADLSIASFWDQIGEAINRQEGELAKSTEAFKDNKEAMGTTGEEAEDAAGSYTELEESVDGVVTSVADLAAELAELNGTKLDAREAARQLEAAYDDFDAALKENGKTLDTTTEAGRNNQAALDDIAQAALDSGQAIIDAGGGYEQYRASLETSRAALLTRINDLGISGDAANALADEILRIPSATEWEAHVRTEQALKTVDSFIWQVGQKVAVINVRANLPDLNGAVSGSGRMGTFADGAKVNFYGNGGRENHVAQFARAGDMRVWAEQETGGEWYIPASPAKRVRSTMLLTQAADEFGYQLVPKGSQSFADGGRNISTDAEIMSGRTVRERPIMMDGSLFGVLREMANGEARLVLNELGRRVR